MDQTIFVTRTLNVKKIKYIGLDMDHTLVRYHTKNFETLVYTFVIDKLVKDKGYPSLLKSLQFNFDHAIRGLVIDSKNGNILKLSRYAAIRQSYHGTKEIRFREQKQIYRSVYVDLKDPNYIAIDTSFSIAFCVLYAQLVDLKDSNHLLPDYRTIALDVLNSVDEVHAEGQLKASITERMHDYIFRDKQIVEGLKRYIQYGKKFFLLTNSDYHYTNLLLNYCITPFLEKNERWQDLFEYIITLAAKPRFFYDDLKFLEVNPEDGMLSNTFGPLKPGVYQGGNARMLTDALAINGDEILYIGDHIYGDILRLKKDCNWRTALIVEELGQEIDSQCKAIPIEKKIVETMNIKQKLEKQHIQLHSQLIENNDTALEKKIFNVQKQISRLDVKITQLLKDEKAFYNTYWGRIFRAGAEESYFAYQVDRFACIYMEKFVDLLDHSPLTYFRAYRRRLAHDIQFV